ncbi:MAG: hypothetical protein WBO35_04040 [Candidatus Saccharimonadales bacterium]
MKKAKQNKNRSQNNDFDGAFLLKLTLFVILGTLWVKVTKTGSSLHIPVPVGLIIGLLFSMHEHFKVDRKIEYAVLVVAALFGFIAPFGLYVTL